jgi:hypothetical protein
MPQEPYQLVRTDERTETYYDVIGNGITGRIIAGDTKMTYEVRATGWNDGNDKQSYTKPCE